MRNKKLGAVILSVLLSVSMIVPVAAMEQEEAAIENLVDTVSGEVEVDEVKADEVENAETDNTETVKATEANEAEEESTEVESLEVSAETTEEIETEEENAESALSEEANEEDLVEENLNEDELSEDELSEDELSEESSEEDSLEEEPQISEDGVIESGESWEYDTATDTLKIKKEEYGYFEYPNSYRQTVKKVIIENGVKKVGGYAFENCANLESVSIPNSVTQIGPSAFARCEKLAGIVIPNTVTIIGGNAFESCTSLTKIEIPSSVSEIAYGAFHECTKLTEVVIPDSVVKLGDAVFSECDNLKSVKLPSKITSISSNLFSNCGKLTDVNIPSGVTEIGAHAFYNCTSLSKIVIPEGVTVIGNTAFYSCENLSQINIPSSVTTIGNSVFQNCNSLTDIVVPSSVNNIGECAFYNSEYLNIKCQKGSYAEKYAKENGISYICTDEKSVGGACGDDVDWKIDVATGKLTLSGVGEMYDYSNVSTGKPWSNHRNYIKSIEIGSGITNITGRAFSGCSNVTNVKISSSVSDIGSSAFYDCYKLKSINLPKSLSYIRGDTFMGCISLEHIDIPANVTGIDYEAFYGCISLKGITIPSNVESIGGNCFYGCTSLTEITLPSSVSSIGSSAFAKCENLVKVTIQNIDPHMGDNAFEGCSKVKLYGYDGSLKSYARKYSLPFKAIGKVATVKFDDSNGKNGLGYISESSEKSMKYAVGKKYGYLPKVYNQSYNGGYVFKGWFTKKKGGQKVTENTICKKSTKLYAQWTKVNYTIVFNANGGKGKMDDIKAEGSRYYFVTNKFSRKGYTFTGWNTKKDGKGIACDGNNGIRDLTDKNGAKVILYAQWKPITFKVKFNANGGKGKMNTIPSIPYGTGRKLRANAYTKSGYVFSGWATSKANANKGKVAYKDKAVIKNLTTKDGKTITLYAVWKKK